MVVARSMLRGYRVVQLISPFTVCSSDDCYILYPSTEQSGLLGVTDDDAAAANIIFFLSYIRTTMDENIRTA